MTISAQELREEALKFIEFLSSRHYHTYLHEGSFRDYHVKLQIDDIILVLYHKPSKKSFSIGLQEVKNPQQKELCEKLWYEFKYPNEQKVEGLCAYVDGTCKNNKIGWGLVLSDNQSIITEKYGLVNLSMEEGARQIAGEITAVLEAVQYAEEHAIKSITIFYDYKGLEMWAEKKWKAQSAIAQFYVGKLMQTKVKIFWHKVQAHAGHPLNNRADLLAKQATE